jgi:uncharacterized membrane protein YhaH (DUF805 family)
MSKPVFEDLFRFSGRRNRKSYFLYSVCFLVVLLVEWGLDFRFDSGGSRHIVQWVMWGLAFRLSDSEGWSTFVLAFFLTALIAITVAVSGLAVASQRCRDFGWTGWAALVTLIPYVGWFFAVAIIFAPGTSGPNSYGPDPFGNASATLPAT